MKEVKVVEGSEAVALAVKACRPHVVSAFPISPQTHIVESLARMVADGDMSAEYIRTESEFSAASVLAGASAAGSRSYTASSSQGLLLMTEVLYASAGMRLPFVITGVNRSISAPINIQVDHQDTMSLRDAGLIQFYVESCQEAYDIQDKRVIDARHKFARKRYFDKHRWQPTDEIVTAIAEAIFGKLI